MEVTTFQLQPLYLRGTNSWYFMDGMPIITEPERKVERRDFILYSKQGTKLQFFGNPNSRLTTVAELHGLTDLRTCLDKPLGFQEDKARRIHRQSPHEGGKVISPTHQPPLPSRSYPWYSFLLAAESTPEPHCGRKD
jgi:hypothetical protein